MKRIPNCLLIFLCGMAVLTGCEKELQTGYGRAAGIGHSGSVNGTKILHRMIQADGRDVDRYSKFSPRWGNYQTVFWIPDSFDPPDVQIIQNIESWLMDGRNRTLVYVARDYDAAIDYWEQLETHSINGTDEKLRRNYHDATSSHLFNRHYLKTFNCDWYDLERHQLTQADSIFGPLVEGIESFDVQYSYLPKPGEGEVTGKFGNYDVEVMMGVDDKPFVYSLSRRVFPGSRIIIVGNASFLLNLPLANQGNREIAKSLIDFSTENMRFGDPVLFIENNYDLQVADRDSPEVQTAWSWITQEPLRYIVPYVLFSCLLFCFVYFPIFGRPERAELESTSNFREHIDALGRLMGRAKQSENTEKWIEEYRRRAKKKSNTDKTKTKYQAE